VKPKPIGRKYLLDLGQIYTFLHLRARNLRPGFIKKPSIGNRFYELGAERFVDSYFSIKYYFIKFFFYLFYCFLIFKIKIYANVKTPKRKLGKIVQRYSFKFPVQYFTKNQGARNKRGGGGKVGSLGLVVDAKFYKNSNKEKRRIGKRGNKIVLLDSLTQFLLLQFGARMYCIAYIV